MRLSSQTKPGYFEKRVQDFDKKYGKGKFAGQLKIRESIKTRRERIKLEPIIETGNLKADTL